MVVDKLRGRYVAPKGHTDPHEVESLLLDVVIDAVIKHTDADRLVDTMLTYASRRVGEKAKVSLRRRLSEGTVPLPADHLSPGPTDGIVGTIEDEVAAYADVLSEDERRILAAVMYLRDGESISERLPEKDRLVFYRHIRPKMQQRLGGGGE